MEEEKIIVKLKEYKDSKDITIIDKLINDLYEDIKEKKMNKEELLMRHKKISFNDLMKRAGYPDVNDWVAQEQFDDELTACQNNAIYHYLKNSEVCECHYDDDNKVRFNFIMVFDFDDNDNIIDESFYI